MQEQQKLYNEARITRCESEFLIMSFFLRYSLPDRSWENFLKLIDCHLPESKYLTKYRFFKRFPKMQDFYKHYYCAICEDYLEIPSNIKQVLCAYGTENN